MIIKNLTSEQYGLLEKCRSRRIQLNAGFRDTNCVIIYMLPDSYKVVAVEYFKDYIVDIPINNGANTFHKLIHSDVYRIFDYDFSEIKKILRANYR